MGESTLLARLTGTTLSCLDYFIPNKQMKNIDLVSYFELFLILN